ncbi:MAG: methyltransferase domain-containing protein [Firmicutes bacterium]|nr:methyltransferase domain-containing protein [Bacillota bacterium]
MKKHLAAGSCVLDVGCGDGWLAEALPQYEWHGVEPDPVLRAKALAKGVRAVPGRAEGLPFPDGHFDAVCIFDVLEHLLDDVAAAQEVKRVLKPGGLLFVSVPLHPELWSGHDVRCGHCRRYRKGEVAGILEKRGFRLAERRYFVSLLLPAALASRWFSCGPGKLAGVLDALAEKLVAADAALNLPFGLTEMAAAERNWRRGALRR